VPCPNESVLIPLQNAGQWATTTDPITEEAIWVRADVAGRVAEQLITRAVAGDAGLLLGTEPPAWVALAHHLLRLDVALWALFTAPWRWLRRRPALRG
jgi:hypothetical protein